MNSPTLRSKPWLTFIAGEVFFLMGSGFFGLSVFSESWVKDPTLLWMLWICAALLIGLSVFLNIQAVLALREGALKKKDMEKKTGPMAP